MKLERVRYTLEKIQVEKAKEVENKEKKVTKIEKKRKLEKHWEMLKWVTQFIEEHTEVWGRMDQKREKERAAWEEKTKDEKIELIKNKENLEKSKEEKLEIAKTKKKMWTEWRGKEQPVAEKKQRSDEVSPSTPIKAKVASGEGVEKGGVSRGDPEMGKAATPPTYKEFSPIVGDMIVGPAVVRYSHCAERSRRHFQINVYKSYERSSILGTIDEAKEPPPESKKRVTKVRNRGVGGGESEKKEALAHTLKKSLHLATGGRGVCESQNSFKIFNLEDNIKDLQDTQKIRIFSEK